MQIKAFIKIAALCGLVCAVPAAAENIDPYQTGSRYAWGENVGWLNFEPDSEFGVQVDSRGLTGWIWAENIGWISLSCDNTNSCRSVRYGVVNDGSGNLSGYAWGENVGWINFDPYVIKDLLNYYKVSIDGNGRFSGWAWGENIGWIRFDGKQSWNVRACVVTLDDLANFAEYWLALVSPGDLDASGDVDMEDFAILAAYWQDFCPAGWPLKDGG
jgi:hypothetical protein